MPKQRKHFAHPTAGDQRLLVAPTETARLVLLRLTRASRARGAYRVLGIGTVLVLLYEAARRKCQLD